MLLVQLRHELLALKVPLAAVNGYRMAKHVMRIEVVESFKHIARYVAAIGQPVTMNGMPAFDLLNKSKAQTIGAAQ